jgi:hypothetical protein
MPVLVVDPLLLGDVEPDEPECPVLAHPSKQLRDLLRLTSVRTHS